MVGGIVAGSVGGSALQVSGPAAGLTVVVAGLIDELGWEMTCVITICAGAIQILFGLIRVARAALAVAPVVVHAMLAGIGVTIVLQQIHVLMGGTSRSSAWKNIEALPSGILHHELHEVIIGGMVIAILLVWPKLPAKIRYDPGRAGGHRDGDRGARWSCDLRGRANLPVRQLLRRHRLAAALRKLPPEDKPWIHEIE